MAKRLDILPGDKYGRLIIVREVERVHINRRRFLCKCACGRETAVDLSQLRSGHIRSCGCLQAEAQRENTRTHGGSKTRLYSIWAGMRARCLDPNATIYRYYGGRGIRVCAEWEKFEAFRSWALEHGYTDELSIERINCNGDYEPVNCKWIQLTEQPNNTRKSIVVTYRGKSQNLKQWALELGIRYLLLYKRIVTLGWSAEEAFERPPTTNLRYIRFCGEVRTLSEWGRVLGISQKTLQKRLSLGWSTDKAFTTPVMGRCVNGD